MTISGSKHSQFAGIDLGASFKGIAGDYGVWFNEIRVTEFVNLRGDSTHSGFLTGVQRVTGVELPVIPNTVVRSGGLSCHWLGPDEWLMTVKKPEVSIMQDLEDSLSGLHIAVTDLPECAISCVYIGPARRRVCAGELCADYPGTFECSDYAGFSEFRRLCFRSTGSAQLRRSPHSVADGRGT